MQADLKEAPSAQDRALPTAPGWPAEGGTNLGDNCEDKPGPWFGEAVRRPKSSPHVPTWTDPLRVPR